MKSKVIKKRTLTLAGYTVFSTIAVLMLLFIFILQQNNIKLQMEVDASLEKSQQLIEVAKSEQNALERDLAEVEYLSKLGSNISVCAPNSTFKSFMDYREITDETSNQFALLQKGFSISTHGILVQDGRFLVAMSKEYGPIGTDLTITLENVTLRVRVADIKHQGCTSDDGSMLEFLVDANKVYPNILEDGNFNLLYEGVIKEIRYGD